MANAEQKRRDELMAELCLKMNSFLEEPGRPTFSYKNDQGPLMIKFLADNPGVILGNQDIAVFIESLAKLWVSFPNPKISQYGLDALMIVAEVMQAKYKVYSGGVFPILVNRLGDSKEGVREKVKTYFLKLIEVNAHTPTQLLEKLLPYLNNKNRDLAFETERLIEDMFTLYPQKDKPVSRQMMLEVLKTQLVVDNSLKKECTNVIMNLTGRLGKNCVIEVIENEMPHLTTAQEKRAQGILQEIRLNSEVETLQGTPAPAEEQDEPDLSLQENITSPENKDEASGTTKKPQKNITSPENKDEASGTFKKPKQKLKSSILPPRALIPVKSAPPKDTTPKTAVESVKPKEVKRKIASAMPKLSARPTGLKASKLGEGAAYALHSGKAGVDADEEWFNSAFEDVPPIHLMSVREFDSVAKKIQDDLKTGTEYWEKKLEALKKFRSLILHDEGFEDNIIPFFKNIGTLFMNCLKDLRSQVVRETCLTLSYVCKMLKNKTDSHTLDMLLPVLMTNVISSAKVVSTCSTVTLKFIFMHVNHTRLISTLVNQMISSKSKEFRTVGAECLVVILQHWPVHRLEHQIANLQEGIKKGMHDGPPEGRMAARKAFWAFYNHFPEQGELLLSNMDIMLKKQVMAAQGGSEEPQTQTVSKIRQPLSQRTPTLPRQPSLGSGSVEDLSGGGGTPTALRRSSGSAIPVLRRTYVSEIPRVQPSHSGTVHTNRSNSAIDLHAVQRANARQQYAQLARQKVGSGASLPRPKKTSTNTTSGPASGGFVTERLGRTRSRANVTQSQPSSRSGSPSSRGYQPYNSGYVPQLIDRRPQTPRSQGASRETSPNRFGSKSSLTGISAKRGTHRPPIQPTNRPVMAQKMLVQSLEAENSLLSELYDTEAGGDGLAHKMSPRKTSYRPFEDHSDDSDASSLCSERSFDSYRRTSDDISEIIANCESTQWTDRKEGLVGLQAYLQAGSSLNATELKRITDCFTRMFMDSHTKVFSLFLDTLNELILMHRADLNSWLYVLLTRLLNKLGGDLLGSIQNKIIKSLDVIRESFPPELQMSSVLRFLTDPTQTPGPKVKTAALNYLTKLAAICDPQTVFPPSSPSYSKDSLHSALHKMIGWTIADGLKHGNELRRAAQEAILALFNLNPGPVTMRLAKLPQEYQEAAGSLLKGRVRRSSVSSPGNSTVNSSPPSPSARMASPGPQRHLTRSIPPETELNPEEIYKSLRKTTAEIQNYTYETGMDKPPDKDNTTSKDSGISQLSGTEALEEAMDELSLQSNSSSTTSTTLTNRVLTVRDCVDAADNAQSEGGVMNEDEALRKVVDSLTQPDCDNGENVSILSDAEKRASLTQLTRLIRDSSVKALQDNFRPILRILLGNLTLETNNRDVQSKILTLNAFTELLKKRAITESFTHFTELVILKVLNCYKDNSKEVVRSGETCANMIATTLPADAVIRVLTPLIQTGEYPLNLAAIKMLTKLVDACGRDPIMAHLPDFMPGLLQSYDNQESSVRKSAVFCMVSLHSAIGEEGLKPHLAALNGSKLKLLHLYIRRSQQGSSAPTSPRNHPPTS
ncbi:CLIP-associating protein 2 isoform X5 [Macrosteles quadrilineatus]|uniref:CLIP-associating protein 2 isoform X5 n=1 Tax=Macrosteles quadrilineatus TaxID=74068 RepID=UPI0023E330C4|nr:CLIP-associating protein 2 isoform X5 [Macrosteles quadrilineatus]